jgi:hypothetical protein
MQLTGDLDANALAVLGRDAVRLLCSEDIGTLVERFGYALAFGREPVIAIREDLRKCLSALGATALAPPHDQPAPTVKHFKPNDTGLLAVVECQTITDNGAEILIELIVTSNGTERHITLEDISVAV